MSKFSFPFLCLIIAVSVSGGFVNGNESKVEIYELKRGDFSFKATNYGARMVSLILPDKTGKLVDVVLGFESVKDYLNDTKNFGALVGRVVNRIKNAEFTLNGVVYHLDKNSGNNSIHGGKLGYNKVNWTVQEYVKDGPNPFIVFGYNSFDGEGGFPGNLSVTVTYALLHHYKLSVIMKAKALNKATPVNLATHTYWNLGGQNSGNILSDEVQIFASRYTPADKNIPTGEIAPVKGTPYDFLKPRQVGSRIHDPALNATSGYDINYALDGYDANKKSKAKKKMSLAVIVKKNKKTGIGMKISTTAPGMQFYTANFVNNITGKGGYVYQPYCGYAFETQGFPDAVNHPNFPSTIVNPGEIYTQYMLYEFQVAKKY
ncbi:OLC1v1009510C1 [Oldenlandia corymbosa var. corymbosa]|uniref:Aldose 1-epimerase n=1 Tax=Oldenlandia corymbosa var. corymbosa TaxID=529605 RepID=A0AAV1DP49_OLDCO|nr:OLC1v1009510C1 [Oldenlandia corymbosa var. corymbosa]